MSARPILPILSGGAPRLFPLANEPSERRFMDKHAFNGLAAGFRAMADPPADPGFDDLLARLDAATAKLDHQPWRATRSDFWRALRGRGAP